jgi:methylmalonyl-CoA/ethylmalonyl-CoA epimerase
VKTGSPGRLTRITAVVDDPDIVAKRLAECFDAPREGAAIWFGGVQVVLEAPGSPARPRGVFALQLACGNADDARERLGERPCGMRVELRGAAEGEPSQKNPELTRREQRNPEGRAGEPSQKNPELTDREQRNPDQSGITLDHVGVASADNEAAVALLCGRAGFPLESEQTDLEYRIPVETFVSNRYGVVQHAREPEPVGGLRVSFVTVGEVDLELLQDLDATNSAARSEGPGTTRGDRSAIARYVASRGPGLHHLAVRVPDIDARLDRLAAAGLPLIDRRGRPGSRRARIAFVHPRALGGLLIHLVER